MILAFLTPSSYLTIEKQMAMVNKITKAHSHPSSGTNWTICYYSYV